MVGALVLDQVHLAILKRRRQDLTNEGFGEHNDPPGRAEHNDNGTQLGWLVDPLQQHIQIYRPRVAVQTVAFPAQLSGDPLLPGLILSWLQ